MRQENNIRNEIRTKSKQDKTKKGNQENSKWNKNKKLNKIKTRQYF